MTNKNRRRQRRRWGDRRQIPVSEFGGCPLSKREMQVMRLTVMEGLQREAIAQRLHIAASTVASHQSNTYRLLGVHSAAQAAVAMFNAGWLDPIQTEIVDPTTYPDERVTDWQRAYLRAFDVHLRAREDEHDLDRAKHLTDVAAMDLKIEPRSVPSRDWIDRLIATMYRLGR